MYITSNLQSKLTNELDHTMFLSAYFDKLSRLPDHTTDGGDDKEFFVLDKPFKIFVARNETGDYTAMLPEDY
jgi:hypothetical protein